MWAHGPQATDVAVREGFEPCLHEMGLLSRLYLLRCAMMASKAL